MTENKNNNTDANFNKRQFWTFKKLKTAKAKKTTKNPRKFYYLINNKIATDKDTIKRLDSLYIPPAYKDIVIAKSPYNKIQAIGTDIKGRRQYIYNKTYINKRNDRKFDDIIGLGKKIIQIEKDNDSMLDKLKNKSPKDMIFPTDYIPIVIYMLRKYNFRIGNEKYARENNSYGITTLKKSHIHIKPSNNEFAIEFIGKKGVVNTTTDNNNIVRNLLQNLIKNSVNTNKDGFLFCYKCNENNSSNDYSFITPDHIQNFFQEKYNSYITPKMFRTWYGNLHTLQFLENLKKENKLKPRMNDKEIKGIISECSNYVSNKLNNTPSISKKSYIDNKILELVAKNPYKFSMLIPENNDDKNKYLYKMIVKLRNIDTKKTKKATD